MKNYKTEIFRHCGTIFREIVDIRRHLHMYPETGFDVEKTAALVASELEKANVSVKTCVGRTGVVGEILVPGAVRTIAFRADMDALLMQEEGNSTYCSKVPGKAHMCGHDAHTAILIGTARILSLMRHNLQVNVRFIFQPCEETLPGGAMGMIEDGVLSGVSEIYGLHVNNAHDTGTLALCKGPIMAQPDTFEIEIKGQGGHGAMPEKTVDPIVTGAQFVSSLQGVVARNVDPSESAVVSVTRFHSGSSYNVIPESAKIIGTVRTLNSKVKELIRGRLEDVLSGICLANGAGFELNYLDGYPLTINDDFCVDRVMDTGSHLLGGAAVIYPVKPMLGGEDFGYYLQKVQGCFFFLGSGNSQVGMTRSLHDPRFDLDEKCMNYGMALFAGLALHAGSK